MGENQHKVLIPIPDNGLAGVISEIIVGLGYQPVLTKTEDDAISIVKDDQSIAATVVDWELSQKYFPNILKKLGSIAPYMGKFVLIDMTSEEIKKLIEKGAFCCYMEKPLDLPRLENGLLGCIKEYELKKENCSCVD